MVWHRNLDPANVSNRPEVHDVLRTLRRMTEHTGNRVLIGEVYTKSVHDLRADVCVHDDELQLPMDMASRLHQRAETPDSSGGTFWKRRRDRWQSAALGAR